MVSSSEGDGSSRVIPFPPQETHQPLLPHHKALIENSAISPAVAKARGYKSVTSKAELRRLGFSDIQCRTPALLIPVWTILGEIGTYQLRPDEPRIGDGGKPIKYETPKGTRMVLDIPNLAREWIADPAYPFFITEGARKADAAVSKSLCCIDLLGVCSWRGRNEADGLVALADWEYIALNNRDVYIAFDSDVTLKRPVATALARLKGFLETKKALVRIIYLPPGKGGAKQGLDDFFAAGHDVKDLIKHASLEIRWPQRPHTADTLLSEVGFQDLVIPDGYFIRKAVTGREVLSRDGESQESSFAYAPILITGRLYDEEEGSSSLRLQWRRTSGWRATIVDRGIPLDSRRVVALASCDFPVSSENAKAVVGYLAKFEAANYDTLPQARISSRLGWQGKDGSLGFLWGHTLVRADGDLTAPVNVEDQQPKQWRKDWIYFRAQTPGDDQIALAYRQKGTLDEWINAVKVLGNYPRAQLALYATFVPPLLPILDAPNFIIDWCGRTSTGKTTALRVAASVWGKPDERDPQSAIATWDATRVWLERASSILNGIPLILDDTKRARHQQQVSDLLYAVASGRGRGRGNIKSTAVTAHWRTVLLSTGEAPATSFTQDGGTRTRTIEVRGLPFGRSDQASGRLVNQLNLAIKANHGHAGPIFVRWLLKHRERWTHFAADYRHRAGEYASGASNEAGRLAQYAAAIDIAAILVHEALERPWPFTPPLETLWPDIAKEASDASGEVRTLQELYAWACRHETSFHGRHQTSAKGDPLFPRGEAFGRWDSGGRWTFIALSPDVLKRVLKDLGHDQPEAILAGWKERCWLDVDDDKYTKQCRMGDGTRPRLVVIRRDAFVEADACEGVEDN